jgi:hypothetical protein
MSTSEDDVALRDRAQATDADWEEQLNEETDGSNGCAEMMELLSEMRDGDE